MPKKSKVKPRPQAPVKSPSTTQTLVLGNDLEDSKIGNARAKELIMSTLAEGSEPWKIAESLEHPSDIWKALESRYAPDDDAKDHPDINLSSLRRSDQSVSFGISTPHKTADDTDHTRVEPLDAEREIRREAQARATKEFHDSMPNLDQRLLWALLHGGKPETEAWFNGTSV